MGKAARWLRGLFGMKRPDPNPNPNPNINPNPNPNKAIKDRRNKWSFVKSYREKSNDIHSTVAAASMVSFVGPTMCVDADVRKHAIAISSTSSSVGPSMGVDADASKHVIAVSSTSSPVGPTMCVDADAIKHAIAVSSTSSYVGPTTRVDNASKHVSAVASTSSFVGPTTGVDVSYRGVAQPHVWAAVVIQSCFRSYLARRALRALKGLVKLQALVRGHIMRNKTKETMHCMQAMLRAQARARSFRTSILESPHSSNKLSQNPHPGHPTPEKFELVHTKYAKLDQTPKIRKNCSRISRSNIVNSDDERGDRILEVDPGKPLNNMRSSTNIFQSSHSDLLTSNHIVSHSYTTSKDSSHQTNPSPVSSEVVQSLDPLNFPPQLYSGGSHGGGSIRGPFTPTKRDGSRSFLSGYSDCPSYMGYTQSARAKMRSHSAPKQRTQYDKDSSTKRHTVYGSHFQRGSAIQASFANKAYPGSGRLDRLGRPVRDSTVVYYSGYLN